MPFIKKKGLSRSAAIHRTNGLGMKKIRIKGSKQKERQALIAEKRTEVIAGS